MKLRIRGFGILGLVVVIAAVLPVVAGYETFCRCDCETDYGVFELAVPDDGAAICSLCSTDFCLKKLAKTCKSDEDKEHMLGTCFTRESLKDKVVVYGFIWLVLGMLGYIVVQSWMTK
ncbi:unnamed protein product [Kuraishia capsulata CBS 1993]|uniref:Transmembrane protein n=1 Tax=Kuraishia capsulata CBS 1993 TaxID=1382522 RepID=W6MXM6_9ASCO|nr:uncharacterized protein KUCA_T00005142001 [Kuraishia capsulata CBS 1993]CDK29155.1 unnamed protein product [Kuraishia capsulata CBS 1993]